MTGFLFASIPFDNTHGELRRSHILSLRHVGGRLQGEHACMSGPAAERLLVHYFAYERASRYLTECLAA